MFSPRLAQPARAEAKTTPPPTAVSARKSRRCMIWAPVDGDGAGAASDALFEALPFCLTGPGRNSFHLLFGGRRLLQVGDQVGAILCLGHVDAHALTGRDLLRIGEPAVERVFVPDHARGLQCVGVGEAGGLRGSATENTTMRRTNAV